jgi:hypothetical protein
MRKIFDCKLSSLVGVLTAVMLLTASLGLSLPEVDAKRTRIQQKIEQSISVESTGSISCTATQSITIDGVNVKKYQNNSCNPIESSVNDDMETDDMETEDMSDKGLTCTEKSLSLVFGGTFFEIEKTQSKADAKKNSKDQIVHCTPLPCWFDIFGGCGNPGVITSDEED